MQSPSLGWKDPLQQHELETAQGAALWERSLEVLVGSNHGIGQQQAQAATMPTAAWAV